MEDNELNIIEEFEVEHKIKNIILLGEDGAIRNLVISDCEDYDIGEDEEKW